MKSLRFGTSLEPNLERLTEIVFDQLESDAAEMNGFWFTPQIGFVAAEPTKEYRAKAVANVSYGSSSTPIGKVNIIAFAETDGTGNTVDYKIEGLDTHETPRRKIVGGAEIVIPIGTIRGETWISGLVHLEELALNDADAPEMGFTTKVIGASIETYVSALRALKLQRWMDAPTNSRRAYFTQDPETHYGDAHAIRVAAHSEKSPLHINPEQNCWLQLVGFIQLPVGNPRIMDAAHALANKPIMTHQAVYRT